MSYCCPGCKGHLEELDAAYLCGECDQSFPVVLGIPDFRLGADPYIGIAEDHAKARRLAERFDDLDLRGLVEYYWQLTPDTPQELAQRFVEHALEGRVRGRCWLGRRLYNPESTGDAAALPAASPCQVPLDPPFHKGGSHHPPGDAGNHRPSGKSVLELGCRSGGVLAAAAELGAAVVGIDIAFRWLVVARKCLGEAGLEAQLCCCDAEHLPFPAGSFDLVLAENVLEHTARQAPVLAEAYRALRVEGLALGTTWNRLAPAPEPHVRLWGVGWMPRSVARRYVRWRGKGDYEHVHLLSAFALRRLLRGSPFGGGEIRAAQFAPSMVERLPAPGRGLASVYHAVREWPVAREALALVGPVLEWECVRRG